MMKDNYAETFIANQFIRDNAPDGLCGRERLVKDDHQKKEHYLEFRRTASDGKHECVASLDVFLDRGDRDLFTDDDGNRWADFVVKAHVSWPCWGGTDPQLAGERLDLMQEVCEFARKVEEHFASRGEIWSLVSTKADREKLANERARRAAEQALLVLARREKHMRVGTQSFAEHGDVPEGHYTVIDEMSDRAYYVEVLAGRTFITRTK